MRIPESAEVMERRLLEVSLPVCAKMVAARGAIGGPVLTMEAPMQHDLAELGDRCEVVAYVCGGCSAEHCELRVYQDDEMVGRWGFDGRSFKRAELQS